MKLEQRASARLLRKKGHSIPDIAKQLRVSKGSVSRWVNDVELSAAVLKEIQLRSHSQLAIERRRTARLKNEVAKRTKVTDKAKSTIQAISKKELHLIGVALYWGEGSKRKRNVVEFTNSDPGMIKVMRKFFNEVCAVPKDKFRGHVYLHNHLNQKEAEKYWSKISGVPISQFHKTSVQKNTKRLKKDTLPYGTFALVICDTQLKLSMDGWISGMCDTLARV